MMKHRKCIVKIILSALSLTCFIVLSGCGRSGETAAASVQETPVPVIMVEDNTEETNQISTQPDETFDDTGQVPETESAKAADEPKDETEAAEPDPSASFYAEEISDEVFARMDGKSFSADCTLSRDELRYLHLLYKDIDGNTHEGEMVCNVAIADKLIDIFRQLYEASYPIESMRLVDDYDADDDASMAANNTSCFNFRFVTGTKKISKHGYGMAVDLNPRYNPYIYTRDGVQHIEPENGAQYADRSNDFDYKIDKDDLAWKLFTQAGFTWGGSWKNSKDYQHFQMD